jgi:small-conductance mechanosensitive channel
MPAAEAQSRLVQQFSVERLLDPDTLLQLGVIAAVALAGVWFGARLLRKWFVARGWPAGPGFAAVVREALWIGAPYFAVMLLMTLVDGAMHAAGMPTRLVDVAVQLLALLMLIRVSVFGLRVSLGTRARLKGWGTAITLLVWAGLALHLLGGSDELIALLDRIGIDTGKTRISVWSIAKLIVTVGLFVVGAVWISRWIERRLARMQGLAPNMRIGVAKFSQAFLIGLSVLIGLNASGLDLTTLNVLSGAVGIGLGFGLQSIAANFVSGFVLLMDRSIKPGDVISFTGTTGTSTEGFGWVQELRGRYVVVRDRDGVETLVPNQNLITNSVINWSYTDPRVRLKLPVRISYKDDPEIALAVLLRATEAQKRVLREPKPVARLMAFGDHGIELELRFWISDPQEGVNNVRSDVNRAIWRLFRENGITIPVAQRELRVEMMATGAVPGSGGGADAAGRRVGSLDPARDA